MNLKTRLKHKGFYLRCPRIYQQLDYPFGGYLANALRKAYIEGYNEGMKDEKRRRTRTED